MQRYRRANHLKPRVEVLYFRGCPNHAPAHALVARVVREFRFDAEIVDVEVPDAGSAVEQRFLGSPTVRVDGRDVEPGAEERTDYVLCCRIYRGERGFSGQPDERWVREALAKAMSRAPHARA